MSKREQPCIRLLAGLGVEGDVHAGETVQHRFHVRRNRAAPNLCQVHLIHGELIADLRASGFEVAPGQMGENVTTLNLDLLALPTGARLHLGATAIVEVTGLRTPCKQLERIQRGLMHAVTARDAHGKLVGRAGIMGVVRAGGEVTPGDAIRVERPEAPRRALVPL
jgi:MOSC domain-containing protein YiiM